VSARKSLERIWAGKRTWQEPLTAPPTPERNLKVLVGVTRYDENGVKVFADLSPYISGRRGRAK